MDRLLRALDDVFAFDESPDCVLRIGMRPAGRELVLPDGCALHAHQTIVTVYPWREHLPAYGTETPFDAAWPRLLRLRLQFTLHRLWRYLHNHPEWRNAAALTGVLVFPQGRYGEAARAELAAVGFDPDSLVMSPHGVDSLLGRDPQHPSGLYERRLVRRLTREAAAVSPSGRAESDRYWMSRPRLAQLHTTAPEGLATDEPFYWERYGPVEDSRGPRVT